MLGGLLAVVWTESVQTVLLLIGAVVITVTGFMKVGGWTALAHTLSPLILTRWPPRLAMALPGAREIS